MDGKPDNRRESPGDSERCRYCGKEMALSSPEWRKYEPFCSQRCRLADLDCWFEEEYRIPGAPANKDNDGEPPAGRNKHL